MFREEAKDIWCGLRYRVLFTVDITVLWLFFSLLSSCGCLTTDLVESVQDFSFLLVDHGGIIIFGAV